MRKYPLYKWIVYIYIYEQILINVNIGYSLQSIMKHTQITHIVMIMCAHTQLIALTNKIVSAVHSSWIWTSSAKY